MAIQNQQKKKGFGRFVLSTICTVFGGAFIATGCILCVGGIISGVAFLGAAPNVWGLTLSVVVFVAMGFGLNKLGNKLAAGKPDNPVNNGMDQNLPKE